MASIIKAVEEENNDDDAAMAVVRDVDGVYEALDALSGEQSASASSASDATSSDGRTHQGDGPPAPRSLGKRGGHHGSDAVSAVQPAGASTSRAEYAAVEAAIVAEVSALRLACPSWLVSSAETIEPLEPNTQRGRGPKDARLGWQWECAVQLEDGSPYAGRAYRLVARFPLGFPRVPPKLQVLSVLLHAEVELRDPYEGQLEDTFYETLVTRARRGGEAHTNTQDGANGGANGSALRRPVQPGEQAVRRLRFGVGDRVECNVGRWVAGVVVRLWYREARWESGRTVPYQVRLDSGDLVYAPADVERLIRRPNAEEDGGTAGEAAAKEGAVKELAAEGEIERNDGIAEQKAGRDKQGGDANGEGRAGAGAVHGDGVGAEAPRSAASRPGQEDAAVPDSSSVASEACKVHGDQHVPLDFSLRQVLELFVEALRSPLDPDDDDAVRMWQMLARRHADEVEAEVEYCGMCLHPELFDLTTGPQRDWFAERLWDALHASDAHANPAEAAAARDAALRSICTEVSPGVFTFDMLSMSFCDRLLDELQHYEASGMPVVRPNSMNNYGVVLNSIGLERMVDLLQRDVVRPIAKLLFPKEGSCVDHHHTFMVQYKAGEDLGLDMHTDACDVTLNVCLGKEFVGAGLTLCGLRGAPAGSERRFVYRHAHVRGKALMHLGHHRHGADDIVSGERYNLIMWNKNSTYRLTREFMGKYMQPPSTDRETPDLVCLSYTHDDDYETYKKFPEGKRPRRDQGG